MSLDEVDDLASRRSTQIGVVLTSASVPNANIASSSVVPVPQYGSNSKPPGCPIHPHAPRPRETGRWGIKVTNVEIREIEPPTDIQTAMTRQMSAA